MMKSILKTLVCGLASLMLSAMISESYATVIGFDNLPGPSGGPFSFMTEDGFEIVADTDDWFQGTMDESGNPAPGIYYQESQAGSFPGVGRIIIRQEGGGLFTLGGFDYLAMMNQPSGGSVTLGVTAWRYGLPVRGEQFTGVTNNADFQTFLYPFSGLRVDMIVLVFLADNQIATWGVDNIVIDPFGVPEPSGLALLLCGLVGLAACSVRARAGHRKLN